MVVCPSLPISKPLWLFFLTVVFALSACDFALAQQSDQQARSSNSEAKDEQKSGESISLDQFQKLRKSAPTPAEKVAITDAWLKANPQPTPARMARSFSARATELSSRTSPPKPTEEKAGLRWEVRQGLSETLAQARSSKEAVALTDQFLKVNADALKELAPHVSTLTERRARLSELLANETANKGEPSLKRGISTALLATRVEARTPAEMIALTNQFLRFNAEAIDEAYPSKLKKAAIAR